MGYMIGKGQLHKVIIAKPGGGIVLRAATFEEGRLTKFGPYNVFSEGDQGAIIGAYQDAVRAGKVTDTLPRGYRVSQHFPLSRIPSE
ncbi:MAG: hypothetical protein GF368_00790 [Candidatus Aenigmarchaeota archaeon]|nr:hypothetical protein [Candidatus Aenigmarchaeota archaeon]